MRVFPISNWTELDVWLYIYRERIPVPSLYFAAEFRNPVMMYSVGKDSSVLLQVGGNLGAGVVGGRCAHQKYPSCFFFSIEADGSWSITRPWRSEVVATSISAMIFSRVSAPDSMAPVSG